MDGQGKEPMHSKGSGGAQWLPLSSNVEMQSCERHGELHSLQCAVPARWSVSWYQHRLRHTEKRHNDLAD